MSKKKLLIGVLVLFGALQLVPVARTNPAVVAPLDAPAEVLAVLERACFDCHSNETHWPWYSRIAPLSFLIAHDVEEGREHLNFSEWTERGRHSLAELREECWEEVEDGEMPLWFYTPLHPGAKLDEADLALLRAWAGEAAGEDHDVD